MRQTTIKLAGRSYALRPTFKGALEIEARTGSDPWIIVQDADLVMQMQKRGMPFSGKFEYTLGNITAIIAATIDGFEGSGDDLTEACIEAGFDVVSEAAADVLRLYATAKPKAEIKDSGSEAEKPGK